MKGIITDIHRCTLDDGPGIRTTVFLKGCTLHCAWCHNPETQNLQPELLVRRDKCTGCRSCNAVCPLGLWNDHIGANGHPNRTACTACGLCAAVCPTDALSLAGRLVPAAEVMDTVLLDKIFYDDTGGGMTLSGGEPLMQPHFSRALLEEARRNGINTCVQTCGVGIQGSLDVIMPYVDLWHYDIKAPPDVHYHYTGVDFDMIKTGLLHLLHNKQRVILRCPIVPGVHTNAEYDVFLLSLRSEMELIHPIEDVVCLPYHTYGIDKYAALDLDVTQF